MGFSNPHLLQLSDVLTPGLPYHFARTQVNSPHPYNPHRHDFYEIFFIEGGQGAHHLRSSQQKLLPGHLGFVRPHHTHTFSGSQLLVANLSFEAHWVTGIAQRHFHQKLDFFGPKERPALVFLDEPSRQMVAQSFDQLSHPQVPSLALEMVLIKLLPFAKGYQGKPLLAGHKPTSRPPWLDKMVAQLAEVNVLRGETTAWVAATGQSPAHVSRTVRRHFAATPTDLMNRARLKWAAGLLEQGDRDVLEIALDSGFKNLSHFYECFKKEYGHSPRRHRFLARQVVGGMPVPKA